MQVLESQSNLIEVEQTLSKNAFFSRSPLPGFADAVIFRFLDQNKKYPDKKIYPNFYHCSQIHLYKDGQERNDIFKINPRNLFMKRSRSVLQKSNRKKSLDTAHSDIKKEPSIQDSSKLQPIDLNFIQNHPVKAEYTMIVQLRTIQNLEELFNKFYKFKIKIKELKFNKKQRSIYLKFITQISYFQSVKKQIANWNQVRHVISKMSKTIKEPTQNRRLLRTISIR